MSKYLVIDYVLNYNGYCDTKEEVIESLGYEVDEISFEELVKRVEGEIEIIEIKE
jgi:hypothetical protein